MSTEAVVMMVVAMLVIWGGLGWAMLHLSRRSPTSLEDVHRDL